MFNTTRTATHLVIALPVVRDARFPIFLAHAVDLADRVWRGRDRNEGTLHIPNRNVKRIEKLIARIEASPLR